MGKLTEISMEDETKTAFGFLSTIALGLGLLIMLGMWGCPQYSVYEQRLTGEAELARAEYSRRTAVVEAQAKLDAAKLLNQAEVARAEGLSAATNVVSKSFGGTDAYLRYLWIQSMEHDKSTVIYVPTEAGLPILEAGKR
jgi:regulator of protease activity HflC (stomatin/prohibitin superfamily)